MKLLDLDILFEDVGDNNSFITDFVKSQQLAYNLELYSDSYLYHLQYKFDIDHCTRWQDRLFFTLFYGI